MEWEREQLRRGGPFSTPHEASPAKQVYKPAASKIYIFLELSLTNWSL
jgi:hypothetical protein